MDKLKTRYKKLNSYADFLEHIVETARKCRNKYEYVDVFIKRIEDEIWVCEDEIEEIAKDI